jgi:ribonuclease HI
LTQTSDIITIYTDGGCDPNPGPGGWAALLLLPQGPVEISGREDATTNNRMELTAAVQALKHLKSPSRVMVYTDSQYLQRGITEWLPGWRARGWKRSGGKLANVELWQELVRVMAPHQVEWRWVKAHAGNVYNQRVDDLVQVARRLR